MDSRVITPEITSKAPLRTAFWTLNDHGEAQHYRKSTGMRFNAPSDQLALLVQPVAEIALAAHQAITTNQYASNLIIGFSPNRWNSLIMIARTSSALSEVVMIES